ncbi:MAG: transcriptional repressor LexA [Planctomycetota bacterium]|nr:transcriptional repressor LexA [Planctomycetota bacterium]
MNYTPKQLQILRLIYDYQQQHGFSPTYAELAKDLGVSTITVFEHLEALERKGAIRRRRHEARSVEIIEPNFLREQGNRKTLPLRGSIAAGKPLEAVETSEEVPIGDVFGPSHNTFVLKVKGDSMIEDHIVDGDMIVVEGCESARDGEIVVALLPDGQATLKRYYKENGRIRLQPSNSTMQPIYAENVKVQGIYRGLVRKLR